MQLKALIDFYEQLTLQDVSRFGEFYSDDAYFKDPFNEVRGVAAIEHIFRHMFQQVAEPRFIVTEQLVNEGSAMLVWEFHFRLRSWKPTQIQTLRGVSHLKFDAAGKVAFHRDYWDSGEELYMKLPLLGSLMKCLRKAFAPPN